MWRPGGAELVDSTDSKGEETVPVAEVLEGSVSER